MSFGREPKKKAKDFVDAFMAQYTKAEFAKNLPQGYVLIDRKGLEELYLAGYGAAMTKDMPAHLFKS